ncbi:hypothetical protein GNP95_10925 [Paenibacillus woosongensis]|uniref:Uncharacterized protein n=2 Tax=Paenibacillus woosongensis TaxID=307580 RepID=A0A7X2Z0U0_9BACL|nr:hypothetical protein [Paenibacillus woosongensis]
MKNHAKFTAEIAKGISIKETNVEVKLLIPLKSAQEHLVFLSSNQGEKINVFLGDPQAALDFGEDEDAMYQKYTGRYVTTDSSGVVTKVEKPDGEEEDENQQQLFEAGLEQGDDEPDEYEQELLNAMDQQNNSDIPDWMQDESTSDQEMDFGEQSEQNGEPSHEAAVDSETVPEVDKKQLEEFILKEQPMFEDIPFDFPQFLKRRKEEGKTWIEIAKEAGVPSSQINSKYVVYKKRVTKMMKDGGAA